MFELSFSITQVLKVFGLFFVTAIAEILGCYFPYLILNQGKSHWLWVPTALSLAVFVWLLTLHPAASGRIYAAYGGIFLVTSIAWLAVVERIRPLSSDWIGLGLCVAGATIILLGPRFTSS